MASAAHPPKRRLRHEDRDRRPAQGRRAADMADPPKKALRTVEEPQRPRPVGERGRWGTETPITMTLWLGEGWACFPARMRWCMPDLRATVTVVLFVLVLLSAGLRGRRERSSDAKIVFNGGYPWLTVGDKGSTARRLTDHRRHQGDEGRRRPLLLPDDEPQGRVLTTVGDAGFFVGPLTDDPPPLKTLRRSPTRRHPLLRNSAGTRRTEIRDRHPGRRAAAGRRGQDAPRLDRPS